MTITANSLSKIDQHGDSAHCGLPNEKIPHPPSRSQLDRKIYWIPTLTNTCY